MTSPTTPYRTDESRMLEAAARFWGVYYEALVKRHAELGRVRTEPVRDRNKDTTNSKHILVFERFWAQELAAALGVDPAEVGPRQIRFRPYRSKKFDVCYPKAGEPKILISIKSMQNAYRNMTNRVEEALGDSAILRLYEKPSAFGFFFFVLDGNVPRGRSSLGINEKKGRVAPYLDLVEEGGDFFDLSDADRYRKPPHNRSQKERQNVITSAQQSLLDLVSESPQKAPGIKYDAMGFLPTCIRRRTQSEGAIEWDFSLSEDVPACLHYSGFVSRLVEAARLRGLV